jgi:hypothetical protein
MFEHVGAAVCERLIIAMHDFRNDRSRETPYAFALIGGQSRDYVGYAVATEEGLRRVTESYFAMGYRSGDAGDSDIDMDDQYQDLAAWVRWANPDDGWYQHPLPGSGELGALMRTLVFADGFDDNGYSFEEFSVDVIARLQAEPTWRAAVGTGKVVLGFTYGEDPRDFLRSATRVNPYPIVRRLWSEVWRGESLDITPGEP